MKGKHIVSLVVLLIVAGAVYWLSTSVQIAIVPTESMLPTLKPGDYLTVRTDAYEDSTPERGDIVIFTRSGEPDYFVKRVIGLGGEFVFYFSGRVWIGRYRLNEPYVNQQQVFERPGRTFVGENEYFVMGDNRGHSEDSRDYGPISEDQIIGRAVGIIYPLGRRTNLDNPFHSDTEATAAAANPTAAVSSQASPAPRTAR